MFQAGIDRLNRSRIILVVPESYHGAASVTAVTLIDNLQMD
jgi:hypothetical protein